MGFVPPKNIFLGDPGQSWTATVLPIQPQQLMLLSFLNFLVDNSHKLLQMS